MHNLELPDLLPDLLPNLLPDLLSDRGLIKTRNKKAGGITYMQCLDQAAQELYGRRHFHKAKARVKHAANDTPIAASPLQYYLRTVQEYYLDF